LCFFKSVEREEGSCEKASNFINCINPCDTHDSSRLCRKRPVLFGILGSNFQRNPVIIEGRILVPARTTFQVLGVTTEWYSSSGVVKMVKGNKAVYMEAPPILVNGTVMVPMRFVAETFGENVGWDAKNEMAYIGNKPAEIPSRSGLKSNRTLLMPVTEGANRALCTEE